MSQLLAVFLATFVCYQSAEAIGMRLLHSPAWQAALMTATIPVGLLAAGWAWRAPLRSFVMQPQPGALRWLLACLGGALSLKLVAVAAGAALGVYTVTLPAAAPVPGAGAFAGLLAIALVTTFIPSLAEDMLTRGLLAPRLPRLEPLAFVLLSTLVYVLNHLWRLANGPVEWLLLAAFGAAYATALVRSGTLWAAVGLHWGWNLANTLLPQFADLQVRSATGAVALSVAAHGLMLVACLAWPPAARPGGQDAASPAASSRVGARRGSSA